MGSVISFRWPWSRKSEPKNVWASGMLSLGTHAWRRSEAEQNSVVMSVVQWAARTFTEPALLVEQASEFGWISVPDHPAARVANAPHESLGEPSKISGRALWQAVLTQLILDGNAYIHKVRGTDGRVIGLDWLPSSAVEPEAIPGTTNRLAGYRLRAGVRETWLPSEDVIHIVECLDPDMPLRGKSALLPAMREVITDNLIARYQQSLMRAPAPGLLVSVRDPGEAIGLTPQFVNDTKRLLQQVASGDNAGGVVFPSVPLDVAPIGFSPEQMALHQMPRLTEERITAVLGVPAIVLGLGAGWERSTFSNFREAREAAIEQFLVPKWNAVADALNDQLLAEFEPMPGWRFRFETEEVRALQEDQDARHERVRADFTAGLLDRDAAATLLGYSPGANPK
ncbi:MAG: phage portal protein [Fimbriimonadaceae bacterium]|nr:phage portal protein [Fimbriimonadaceae bacterium]